MAHVVLPQHKSIFKRRPYIAPSARIAPALITLDRKLTERRSLFVASGAHDPLISGWRFGPRLTRCGRNNLSHSVRRRLGLISKDSLRCCVGRGCWRHGVLAGDCHRRCSGVALATNRNAITAKPAIAKKERTGIAAVQVHIRSYSRLVEL
jgi:hypothetical protein